MAAGELRFVAGDPHGAGFLRAPGVKEKDVELLKALVNQVVLPRLEGVEVYGPTTSSASEISAVKVLPGRLDISMA